MRTRTTIALLALLTAAPVAQESTSFTARLSPLPRTAATVDSLTGSGEVTAVLTGTTLTIGGRFDGLQSPATLARVHIGERTGMRGPAVFEVQVTEAPRGAIAATLDLRRVHLEPLQAGRFYVQLHSQTAPEGNLWGWLLAPEDR
jgi:hypothetical protein